MRECKACLQSPPRLAHRKRACIRKNRLTPLPGMTKKPDSPRILADVACLGCGCVCDDIELVVESDQIVEARRAWVEPDLAAMP